MTGVLIKFFLIFIPTLVLELLSFGFASRSHGLISIASWVICVLLAIFGLLQISFLLSGLAQISKAMKLAQEKMDNLGERDEKLFAEGSSFEEVIAQYRKKD